MASRRGKSRGGDRFYLGSKITVDCVSSHDIKRCLLLGRKAMTNLDSVIKSRDIILLTKVHIVKAMGFLVVMCGCESWTIKKAEHWRMDAFKLWCWRGLLRVPWTARKSKKSILEINLEYSLEGLMLKLQCFGHLMWTTNSLEKTLVLGKNWRQKEKGVAETEVGLDSTTDSVDMNQNKLKEVGRDKEARLAKAHGIGRVGHDL